MINVFSAASSTGILVVHAWLTTHEKELATLQLVAFVEHARIITAHPCCGSEQFAPEFLRVNATVL
jgi:hypothetical protein